MKQVDRSSSLGTVRKKAVWGCSLAALVAVSSFTACEQAPRSLLGPTASVSAGRHAVSDADNWGARGKGVTRSAANDSEFFCALGPYGAADKSHATISNSGNETVVCTGQAPVAPDKTLKVEGFPCALHFGDGDPATPDVTFDSRAVVTPSGHVTLVCQSQK